MAVPTLLHGTKDSAPDWAFAQLWRRIVTRAIAPGARILEEQLAQEIGVSRTPLRAALLRLEEAGIIVKQRNRAMHVAPLSAAEFEELASLRERIEGLAAHKAALRVRDEGLSTVRLRFIAEQMDARGFSRDAAFDLTALGEHFHAEILKLSGLARTGAVLSNLHLSLERYRHILAENPERAPRRALEHQVILRAIEAGDGAQAEALMRQHIANALQAYLDQLAPIWAASRDMRTGSDR